MWDPSFRDLYVEIVDDSTTRGYPSCSGGNIYIEPHNFEPPTLTQSIPCFGLSKFNFEELTDRFEVACEPFFPVNPPSEPYIYNPPDQPNSIPYEQTETYLEEWIRKIESETEELKEAQLVLLNQRACALQNLEAQVSQILEKLSEDPGEVQPRLDPASTVQTIPPVPEYKPAIPYPNQLQNDGLRFTDTSRSEGWKSIGKEVYPIIHYNYPEDDDFFSDMQDDLDYMVEIIDIDTPLDEPLTLIQDDAPVEQVADHAEPLQPKAFSGSEVLEKEDVESCADVILNYPEHVLEYHPTTIPNVDPVIQTARKPSVDATGRFWHSTPPVSNFIGNQFITGAYRYFHPHLMVSDGFSALISEF